MEQDSNNVQLVEIAKAYLQFAKKGKARMMKRIAPDEIIAIEIHYDSAYNLLDAVERKSILREYGREELKVLPCIKPMQGETLDEAIVRLSDKINAANPSCDFRFGECGDGVLMGTQRLKAPESGRGFEVWPLLTRGEGGMKWVVVEEGKVYNWNGNWNGTGNEYLKGETKDVCLFTSYPDIYLKAYPVGVYESDPSLPLTEDIERIVGVAMNDIAERFPEVVGLPPRHPEITEELLAKYDYSTTHNGSTIMILGDKGVVFDEDAVALAEKDKERCHIIEFYDPHYGIRKGALISGENIEWACGIIFGDVCPVAILMDPREAKHGLAR